MTLTELKKTCDQYFWSNVECNKTKIYGVEDEKVTQFPTRKGLLRVTSKKSNCFYLETMRDSNEKIELRIDWLTAKETKIYTSENGFTYVDFVTKYNDICCLPCYFYNKYRLIKMDKIVNNGFFRTVYYKDFNKNGHIETFKLKHKIN